MYKNIIKSLGLILFLVVPNIVMANEVKICDDKGEWAPFSYYERVDGVADKTKLTGAVTELLTEVFKIVNLKHSIDMIPWKRCTNLVDNYDKTKKYEVFVNGSYNKERAKKFLISKPIYYTHQGVFYSNKKYPNGIPFKNKSDINDFKVCSILGYDTELYYDIYGLSKTKKIDTRAKSTLAVLQKISKDRCDIFINSKEPIYGAVAIGKYKLPKDIKSINIPDQKPTSFHIFIAKKSPRAKELLEKIDKAILLLQNNGISNRIFNKYLPES